MPVDLPEVIKDDGSHWGGLYVFSTQETNDKKYS